MARHTPGPWRIAEPVRGMRGPEAATGDKIIVGADHVIPAIVYEFGDTGKANARLIAAAPDLLAALELALRCLDTDGRTSASAALNAAGRAAIAKATEGE